MTVIKVCGVVFAALMFVLVIKRMRPEYSVLVSVASGVLIIGTAVAMAMPVTESLRDMASQSGFSEYFVRLEESMQNNVIERTSRK